MMSTVGLELTSFINPDLTWKKVSKGNRSGTRRARKPGAKSLRMGMGLGDKDARTVEDVMVSESEKLGVDVLGRRFSDKVEHLPVKKRKFMSPSTHLPLNPPPHLETSGQRLNFQPAPGQSSGSNSAQRRRLMKADCMTKSAVSSNSGLINDVEDFSGIEILAAAACSDSIGENVTKHEKNQLLEESTQDKIESSASAMPLEETTAPLEAACCSKNDSVNEVKAEGISLEDTSFSGSDEPPADKDNTTADPLPDDRLLWDLNLSIDAWPCDSGNIDSQKNIVDNLSMKSEEQLGKEPQDFKTDPLKTEISSDVDVSDNMTSDLKNTAVEADNISREKQESEGCSGSFENKAEPVVVPVIIAENLLMSTTAHINGSVESLNLDQCSSHSPLPVSDKMMTSTEEKKESPASTPNVVPNMVESPVSTPNVVSKVESPVSTPNVVSKVESPVSTPNVVRNMVESPVSTPNVVSKVESPVSTPNIVPNMVECNSDKEVGKGERALVEESDVASPCVPILEMVTDDIQRTNDGKDDKVDADSGLHDVKSSVRDLEYPRPLENQAEHANRAEEMDVHHPSPKSEDMSISDDYVVEATEQTDGATSAYTTQTDSVSHLGSGPPLHSSNSFVTSVDNEFSNHQEGKIHVDGSPSYSDKTNLNNPSNESHESALSQDKLLTVDMGNHSELQAGYDSQFEDGELRESDVQCWEDAEQVDYDTEFEEERSFGFEAESGEKKSKLERGSSSDVTGEVLRENSVGLKMSTVEGPDAETKKNDSLDSSNIRDYDLRVDFSKVSKRDLLSDVERSLSYNAVKRSRSENFDGSYPRAEREVGSDKFIGRDRSTSYMHGRTPGGGHFFNPSAGYWDSKRQHSPIYHSTCNFGRSRPKSVVESRGYSVATDQAPSEAAGVARPDNRVSRQFMGSSNGVYRPLLRRRSPVERDDSYGMHSRIGNVRDTSPDRGRFRRYQQGVNRGIRDEYGRHIPDDSTDCFSRMPHRLGRRERSISPHGGRPHYIPYKKTRSRSRSRSPIGWVLQRDRNEGSRRRSRSPDFRSDARMDRVRLPFTKRFAADFGDEFLSPPRSRLSPQRNPRMFEDRNAGFDHFRGRKSPVRMFRQGQRFDQGRPIRRLNSDDCFRPMIRPRRFPDMAASGKGCKYESSDDDKHGSRCEMINRVRRYDTDAVRRFRYNNSEDATYMANNSLTVTNAMGDSCRTPRMMMHLG